MASPASRPIVRSTDTQILAQSPPKRRPWEREKAVLRVNGIYRVTQVKSEDWLLICLLLTARFSLVPRQGVVAARTSTSH